jgi:hypothetical protein
MREASGVGGKGMATPSAFIAVRTDP